MKTKVKLFAHKILYFVIFEYFLTVKYTKEVVSKMNIITTLFTEEVLRQNKCQISLPEKILLKQKFDVNCN